MKVSAFDVASTNNIFLIASAVEKAILWQLLFDAIKHNLLNLVRE